MDYIFRTFMISCVRQNLGTFPVFICYQAKSGWAVAGCMNISEQGADKLACLRRREAEPETRFRQEHGDPPERKTSELNAEPWNEVRGTLHGITHKLEAYYCTSKHLLYMYMYITSTVVYIIILEYY